MIRARRMGREEVRGAAVTDEVVEWWWWVAVLVSGRPWFDSWGSMRRERGEVRMVVVVNEGEVRVVGGS